MATPSPTRPGRVLPGFALTLGMAASWLGLIVLLPLLGVSAKALAMPGSDAWALLSSPRTVAAFRVSLVSALAAAAVNVPLGVLVAWVLTRYRPPLRRLLDAAVDLPFALPTAVAGITLTTLLAPDGLLGGPLAAAGVSVAYTPLGITVALVFAGLPFMVRSVQPVLAAADRSSEEAALLLGASPWRIFASVIWPGLVPAVVMGAALAFARGVGEYGSVIFIAGNMPMVSEILPLLIVTRLEQFDYPGASVLGVAMLALSVLLLLLLQAVGRRLG